MKKGIIAFLIVAAVLAAGCIGTKSTTTIIPTTSNTVVITSTTPKTTISTTQTMSTPTTTTTTTTMTSSVEENSTTTATSTTSTPTTSESISLIPLKPLSLSFGLTTTLQDYVEIDYITWRDWYTTSVPSFGVITIASPGDWSYISASVDGKNFIWSVITTQYYTGTTTTDVMYFDGVHGKVDVYKVVNGKTSHDTNAIKTLPMTHPREIRIPALTDTTVSNGWTIGTRIVTYPLNGKTYTMTIVYSLRDNTLVATETGFIYDETLTIIAYTRA